MNGSVSVSESKPWWSRMADGSYVGMFVLGTFPETVTDKMYIGPAPLVFCFFYLGLIGVYIESRFTRGRCSRIVTLGLSWAGFMILHGLARGNSFKFLVIDCTAFMGLVAGMDWVGRRSLHDVLRIWRLLSVIVLSLLALSLVGLQVGFVAPSRQSGRLYVKSMFLAVYFLIALIPMMWTSNRYFPLRRYPDWFLIVPFLLALLMIFAASVFSATRSIFISGSLSSLFLLRISFHRHRHILTLPLIALVIFAFTVFDTGSLPKIDTGMLGKRFTRTEGLQETRFVELFMLWNQMSFKDLLIGTGFGSRFHSAVIVDGSDLAVYPHIAVFAFLYKGGFGLFGLYIIGPLFYFLYRVIRGKGHEIEMGFWSGALLYLMMASMSAGWDFHRLFLYGGLLGLSYLGVSGVGFLDEECS